MAFVSGNKLNRLWQNHIKPIKDSVTVKLDASRIVNSLLTTAAGYALDARQGKVLDDKISQLNSNMEALENTNYLPKLEYLAAKGTTSKISFEWTNKHDGYWHLYAYVDDTRIGVVI